MTDHGLTCRALAREHGVTSSYASRVIRLNFLAPDIVEAIIAGTQPVQLDAKTLLGMHEMPLGWTEQKRAAPDRLNSDVHCDNGRRFGAASRCPATECIGTRSGTMRIWPQRNSPQISLQLLPGRLSG